MRKALITVVVIFFGSVLMSSCNTRGHGGSCPAYGNSHVSVKHVGKGL